MQTQSKYSLKAGTRLIFTDAIGRRIIGFYRFPAVADGFLCVTKERASNTIEVIHKTDIIAVA